MCTFFTDFPGTFSGTSHVFTAFSLLKTISSFPFFKNALLILYCTLRVVLIASLGSEKGRVRERGREVPVRSDLDCSQTLFNHAPPKCFVEPAAPCANGSHIVASTPRTRTELTMRSGRAVDELAEFRLDEGFDDIFLKRARRCMEVPKTEMEPLQRTLQKNPRSAGMDVLEALSIVKKMAGEPVPERESSFVFAQATLEVTFRRCEFSLSVPN